MAVLLARDSRYNPWLEDKHIKVHVRFCGFHNVGGKVQRCVDISNVIVKWPDQRGQGHFTRFLSEVEQVVAASQVEYLYVENILDERFRVFFRKRGYTEVIHDPGRLIPVEDWPSQSSFYLHLPTPT